MNVKKVKNKSKKKFFLEKLKKINWTKVLTLTPRILIIIYIIFISIFAFDESLFTLPWFVHLMPTIILTLIVIFTWRRPLAASIIFFILGIGFTFIFRTYGNWIIFSIISLPLILAGVLFLLERLLVKKRNKEHKEKIKERKDKLMKRR